MLEIASMHHGSDEKQFLSSQYHCWFHIYGRFIPKQSLHWRDYRTHVHIEYTSICLSFLCNYLNGLPTKSSNPSFCDILTRYTNIGPKFYHFSTVYASRGVTTCPRAGVTTCPVWHLFKSGQLTKKITSHLLSNFMQNARYGI